MRHFTRLSDPKGIFFYGIFSRDNKENVTLMFHIRYVKYLYNDFKLNAT